MPVRHESSSTDNKIRNTVIGVGVAVIVITLIVLIVVIIYVYKSRQRAYNRKYDIQERLSELNYNDIESSLAANNGGVSNGRISSASTTPFGLSSSHA